MTFLIVFAACFAGTMTPFLLAIIARKSGLLEKLETITKADLEALETRVKALEASVESKVKNVFSDVKSDVASDGLEIESHLTSLQNDVTKV